MSMTRTPFPVSISKVNDIKICKEVRCCCSYDNQTFKILIFCSYYLHCITQRLRSIRHSSAGVLSDLIFVRLKTKIYDIFVLK